VWGTDQFKELYHAQQECQMSTDSFPPIPLAWRICICTKHCAAVKHKISQQALRKLLYALQTPIERQNGAAKCRVTVNHALIFVVLSWHCSDHQINLADNKEILWMGTQWIQSKECSTNKLVLEACWFSFQQSRRKGCSTPTPSLE
jgi:hypothetical protein